MRVEGVGLRVLPPPRPPGSRLFRPPPSPGVQVLVLLRRNVERFRGGLVFKAHRRVYHSTLGWRVTKKMEEDPSIFAAEDVPHRHRPESQLTNPPRPLMAWQVDRPK